MILLVLVTVPRDSVSHLRDGRPGISGQAPAEVPAGDQRQTVTTLAKLRVMVRPVCQGRG
jgi:hypothetical protein